MSSKGYRCEIVMGIRIRRRSLTAPLGIKEFIKAGLVMTKAFFAKHSVIPDFFHILLYLFPVISDSVTLNSLDGTLLGVCRNDVIAITG